MGTTKEMRLEVLLGIFILGGVSSHGKTVQQGCAIIRLQFLSPLWRMECRSEAG